MPWGIWKILNMVAGVALSTGGFAFAAATWHFSTERLPAEALCAQEALVCLLTSMGCGVGHLAPGYGARIFCTARAGDWRAAALTLDMWSWCRAHRGLPTHCMRRGGAMTESCATALPAES